jgi:SAM-dependent methyltransferase
MEREVDERVVHRIMESWRLIGSPARPDATVIERFRSAMTSPDSALVMGATPELIDMLLNEGVRRIAAMELHPETMEAMRRLAHEDWSRVERVVGDWGDPRPGWDSAFDVALCDGGLMFLPFPDAWRRVLAVIRGYLRPGGRLVSRTSGISPSKDGFREPYAQAVAAFESERPALDPERRARRFLELMSQVRGMCRYGAVDSEGRVLLDVAAATLRALVPLLERALERHGELDSVLHAVTDELPASTYRTPTGTLSSATSPRRYASSRPRASR